MKNEIFLKEAFDVIYMNEIFRDEIKHRDSELIKYQKIYIASEIEETIERGIKKLDVKEFIDGVADVFVTAIFLEYLLCDNERDFCYQFVKQIEQKVDINQNNFVDVLLSINNITEKGKIISILKSIMDYVDSFSNTEQSPSEFALKAVRFSNMSKFPDADTITEEQINKDIEHIRKKTGTHNIITIIKKGKITYINADINKFQKPTTFVEPDLSKAVSLLSSLQDKLEFFKS